MDGRPKYVISKIMENKQKNWAKYIDHTNIDPQATVQSIKKTCEEAKHFKFRGVCVNPEWTKTAASELRGADVRLTTLIDPPMGLNLHSERKELCEKAKENGSHEIDIVINIIDIKYGRYDKALGDLKGICEILPTKVIIGSGFLTDDEIRKASEIVKEAGAICVKTSTFKDPLDHFELLEKARHLKLMRDSAPGLLIKAAGKIKTFEDMKMMIEAGADIIGTSSSVEILEQAPKEHDE